MLRLLTNVMSTSASATRTFMTLTQTHRIRMLIARMSDMNAQHTDKGGGVMGARAGWGLGVGLSPEASPARSHDETRYHNACQSKRSQFLQLSKGIQRLIQEAHTFTQSAMLLNHNTCKKRSVIKSRNAALPRCSGMPQSSQ
jgi:uncharacterized protein YhaN